jgi:predicted Zn-dependent peptidase
MTKPQRIVLPNGLRVIFVPQPENVATTILVLVEAGSKYETKEINGLSHFLEHMCFKGTEKRPKAINIAGELDGIGAEYNAFTSQEWTGYFVKVQSHQNEKALEVISDLYLNPVFDANEIEKEKGVIIEEINMYADMPPRRVQELLLTLMYGDQPAGWDIGGDKEVIRNMKREDFIKYRGAHYLADATTIVITGAFDPEKFFPMVDELFKTIPKGEKAQKVPTTESQSEPQILMRYKKSDQTHIAIGSRAFDTYDDRRYAIQVLSDVLGGGMSSRLFQKVREELGAAYYVRSSVDLFTDHGVLDVSAGVEHSKLETVISAILGELKRFTEELVPTDELKRSKDHLIGRLLLGIETSDSLATYYGAQEVLHQKLKTPEELIKNIEAVTAKEIMDVAQFIFRNDKLNIAMIGPHESEEPFKKLFQL